MSVNSSKRSLIINVSVTINDNKNVELKEIGLVLLTNIKLLVIKAQQIKVIQKPVTDLPEY